MLRMVSPVIVLTLGSIAESSPTIKSWSCFAGRIDAPGAVEYFGIAGLFRGSVELGQSGTLDTVVQEPRVAFNSMVKPGLSLSTAVRITGNSHCGLGDDVPEKLPLGVYNELMREAVSQAKLGLSQGGIPIGSLLVEDGRIVGKGHNRRLQDQNPVAHAEMECLKNAGLRKDYKNTTLYTTLSPCEMCSGTIRLFGIKKVVIGENKNFKGDIGYLRRRRVEVVLLNNDQEAVELLKTFILENPDIWFADIGGKDGY